MSDIAHHDGYTLDGDRFQVLINAEEQHAVWPSEQPVPAGWTAVGPVGAKSDCLAYVETHWRDMRPKRLRP